MRFISSLFIVLLILSCDKESPSVSDPVISFTLTVTSGVGGSVSSPGGSYTQGKSVSITATPNSEYVFVDWSNGSTDNPISITVNSNQTVTANFEKRKYPLTVSITGSGTVSEEIISAGKSTTEYNSGSVIRLTANPLDEWVFTGWSGSVSSTENPIELTVDESKTISVNFEKRKYPLTVSITGSGTVSQEIISAGKSTTEYNSGSVIRLTANPLDEWVFTGWSGSVSSTENPIELTVNESKTISVNFEKRKYPLTVSITGSGTVYEEIISSGKSTTEYTSGSVIRLTAGPSSGSNFIGWSGSVSSTENPIELTVDESKDVTATFEKKLIFEFIYETFPSFSHGKEGMGYISINSKHYIILPFTTNNPNIAVTPDYLRIFEIDSTNGKLHDRTFSIYDEVPEIGFEKSPLFVEDFDNDGFDDLFLVDHGLEDSFVDNRFEGGFLKLYYGSENGFIKDKTEISNLKLYYHHADVGDFDLDGDLDIISQRNSSQTLEVPGYSSITLFKNLGNRNYEIITLESPPAGVMSVLFSNIDDDPELEVLSFSYGEGVIWSWDILENKTEIINNQLGEYKIHDVVEIENNDSSSIIIFPEDYQGIETPIFISTDKCENISSFDIINNFQGRDNYVIDLNNDGLDDLFMYYGTDGEYPTPSSRSFVNSVLINQGNNQFSYPSNVTDTYNKSYNDEKTDNRYLPLKQTSNGYLFFKFGDVSNNGIYPINGKLIDLSFN